MENVICGIDNCAVIVEDLSDRATVKRKKKSVKRTIKRAQMVTSPEELKAMTEARIVAQGPEEKKPLSERVREKWHNTLFGGTKEIKDEK